LSGKSYAQYCGLARALDVVGERWSLLIVRELLIRPARYSDLLAALPGVATNLLAQRLRDLETGGVIERRLGRPGQGVAYALTDWGAGLRETAEALLRWSTPLMAPGPGSDAVRPQWLELALTALLAGRTAAPAAEIALQTAGTVLMVRADQSGPAVTALAPPAELPGAMTVLRAEPPVILGLAAGTLTAEQAIAAADLTGDPGPLRQIFTRPAITPAPHALHPLPPGPHGTAAPAGDRTPKRS